LWKKLQRRWLFLVVSMLCFAAIADLSLEWLRDALTTPIPTPLPSNLLSFSMQAAHQMHVAMALTDAIVLIVGVPLLVWLFAALRRPPSVSAGAAPHVVC
jgi:hypothetical protein